MDIIDLHDKIAAVCPIIGVSVGISTDKTTWRIDYDLAATDQQKTAAQAVVTTYDINAPVVPQWVTKRQAQLALNQQGLLTQVTTAVANADVVTQINWNEATQIYRDNALINGMGAQMGLSSQQIDQLFILAATL